MAACHPPLLGLLPTSVSVAGGETWDEGDFQQPSKLLTIPCPPQPSLPWPTKLQKDLDLGRSSVKWTSDDPPQPPLTWRRGNVLDGWVGQLGSLPPYPFFLQLRGSVSCPPTHPRPSAVGSFEGGVAPPYSPVAQAAHAEQSQYPGYPHCSLAHFVLAFLRAEQLSPNTLHLGKGGAG